jgi:hypothetical protein
VGKVASEAFVVIGPARGTRERGIRRPSPHQFTHRGFKLLIAIAGHHVRFVGDANIRGRGRVFRPRATGRTKMSQLDSPAHGAPAGRVQELPDLHWKFSTFGSRREVESEARERPHPHAMRSDIGSSTDRRSVVRRGSDRRVYCGPRKRARSPLVPARSHTLL